MKRSQIFSVVSIAVGATAMLSCARNGGTTAKKESTSRAKRVDMAQVPSWSRRDMEFFLHGSLGTEMIPEKVLHAFVATYPDLFPTPDFSNFGLLVDTRSDLPIGVSRREAPHLGGMSAIGINCASCHTAEIAPARGGAAVRILGGTGNFDPEAFIGAMMVATWKTADAANMERFLGHYFQACNPNASTQARVSVDIELRKQRERIAATIAEDPTGAKGAGAGGLQDIAPADLQLDRKRIVSGDVMPTVRALLKLFHNMRTAIHVPDQPPATVPPPNGPGRNDAWGLLSYALFNIPAPPAQIKFGLVWNAAQRPYVHFDGNTSSAIVRNLAAALGLGAPTVNGRGILDFSKVQRHTVISEAIRPPKYPWGSDREAAARGAKLYQTHCASCHDGPETDARLYTVAEIGTDANRAKMFDAKQAELYNELFSKVQIEGFKSPKQPLRSTGKYWSPDLAGVWARAPYLHNGSVRTMEQLLTPPPQREKTWKRGTRRYDTDAMGYVNEGHYLLDTTTAGNSNTGHDYGTNLSTAGKRDLIEFLKTK